MIVILIIVLAIDLMAWYNLTRLGHPILAGWLCACLAIGLILAIAREEHVTHHSDDRP